MKKIVIFSISLIVIGMLAYFGAYYAYLSGNPQVELKEEAALQKSVIDPFVEREHGEPEYYLARIEKDRLMIYKMPENTLYDYVELSSLNFHGTEREDLATGISFENLTEVFEFLENSMS